MARDGPDGPPPGRLTTDDAGQLSLACPHCGNADRARMRYVEDIINLRELGPVVDGVLSVEGYYEVGDDGDNPRLTCQADGCGRDFAIPGELEIEFT